MSNVKGKLLIPCPYCEGRRLKGAPKCPACNGFGQIDEDGLTRGRKIKGWTNIWRDGENYFLPIDYFSQDDENDCYF